ncbi:MAG: ThuA domain-containing protein, partial [Candidatus Bathyarchaeota archaeon]|nr:ThuA domain-containing protein [Candidatus Bathyarchaeota archaeon]
MDKKDVTSRRSKSSSTKNVTAFALIGDRFHNSDYIRTALGKTLVREAGLSIDFTDEVTMLSAETL